MGALALSHAREDLRPYELVVSSGCAARKILSRTSENAHTNTLYGLTRIDAVQPLRLPLSIVRSLAHLPDGRNIHHALLTCF
jgi:hypothetical protein